MKALIKLELARPWRLPKRSGVCGQTENQNPLVVNRVANSRLNDLNWL